jgi:hypothetical protein
MSHLEYTNPTLRISATLGLLTIQTNPFEFEFVSELSLSNLLKIYPKWQTLAAKMSKDLPTMYMSNPKVRKELETLLKSFGIKQPRNLSFNQIQALLFYEELEDGKAEPSILWRFHNVFPKGLDLPKDVVEVDYDSYMDLDLFESALLYLAQENKEHLAHEWPLSRVMKIFTSKGFLTWVANPENKAKLLEEKFREEVEKNPTDPDELKRFLEKQMFGK